MNQIPNKVTLRKLTLIILIFTNIYAEKSEHKHDGFYFNFNIGISNGFTTIVDDETKSKVKMSGLGGDMELKIGYSVFENVIVNLAVSSTGTENVKFNTYSNGPYNFLDTNNIENEYRGGEVFIGLGVVYFYMPTNIQFSLFLGTGLLTMENKDDLSEGMNSQYGPGVRLTIGKDFWVSKNWGLGVSANYRYLTVNDDRFSKLDGYEGYGYVNRFSFSLNATYN